MRPSRAFLLFRIAFAPFGRDPLVLPTFSLGKTFGSAILSFEVVCRWRLKSGLIELVPCDFRLGSDSERLAVKCGRDGHC